jgi:pimeloyl-ACP methyl ester carboxylesterase
MMIDSSDYNNDVIHSKGAGVINSMKLISSFVAGLMASLLAFTSISATAQEKVGVVLMHGKQGGGQNNTSLNALHDKMQQAGFIVLKPEMPWSFNRFIDGNWDMAMSEIHAHVQQLKTMGAQKIALVGHSLGSPAALSYAARNPDEVHALGLLAPGHVPYYYSQCIPFSPIRMCGVKDGVAQARQEIAAGNGDKKQPQVDINQGRRQVVWMTSKDYLSYFDPASDAEMAVTAPKIPARIPVLWVIGDKDYLIREGRQYVFDKLPANAKSQYLEVSANHISTPAVASDQIVRWLQAAMGN